MSKVQDALNLPDEPFYPEHFGVHGYAEEVDDDEIGYICVDAIGAVPLVFDLDGARTLLGALTAAIRAVEQGMAKRKRKQPDPSQTVRSA